MMKISKIRLRNIKFYFPFIAMLIFFLFLYRMDFAQGDDFFFSSVGGTLTKICNYYVSYYLHSGSRMANMLAQLFLIVGLKIWKIVTPFVIEGTSLLIYYYAAGSLPGSGEENRGKYFSLACVCAVFPGAVPVAEHIFADTFVWMDGSCNYIYPAFFALLGFIPFYNTVRARDVPRAARFLSPVCLLIAALLHEQAVVLLAAMCIVCLIYFYRDKCVTRYLLILSCIVFAGLLYTLTAPGAYARMGRIGTAGLNMPCRLAVNILSYFYPFASDCWPWTVLMGLCAVFVLRRKEARASAVYYFIIFFGMILSAFTDMLMYPGMQTNPFEHGCDFHSVFGCIECAFLLVYFTVIFAVFVSAAKAEKKYRFLVVLYIGMWASQGIPAVLGVKGRPLYYLVVFALLMALCLFHGSECRAANIIRYAVALLAALTLISGIPHMRSNMAEYLKIENQVFMAKAGKTDVIVIDRGKFDYYYAYFNSFSPRYNKSIHVYYKLQDNVKIIFVHG